MALGSLLPRNALGGWLAGEQLQQDNASRRIQQAIGLASLLERQRAAEQEEQFAPFKMELLQAQAAQARGLADERGREQAFNAQLSDLVRQATGEDGRLDWGRLSESMAQVPGGLKPAMDLRRAEEDRAARVAQQEASLAQRAEFENKAHESRMAQLQRQQDRDAELARHNRVMEGFRSVAQSMAAQNAAAGRRPPAGYRYTPDGNLEPIPGGPGDKKAEINERAVDSLRKEFNSLPEVKNYRTVVPIVQSIRNAKDTPAGDLDYIYAVGKILDPDSVVREGEMNLVIKSGSPLERFKGAVNSVMGGGRLTTATRANLDTMLRQRVSEIERGYKSAETMYRTNAERRNLPTNEIFMDFGAMDLPQPASANSPKPGFTKGGYRFKGGDPAKRENWERL